MEHLKEQRTGAARLALWFQVACYILNMVLYPGIGGGKEEGPQIRDDGVQCRDSGKSGGGGHLRLDGAFHASFTWIPQRTAMWSLGMTYFTKAPDRKTLIKKICTHPCIVSVFIGFVLMLYRCNSGDSWEMRYIA